MIKKFRRLALGMLALGVCLNLYGCSNGGVGIVDGVSTNAPDPNAPITLPTPVDGPTTPKFDPAAGDPSAIPLPNDLLRNPQTGFVDQFPNTPTFNAEPFLSLKSMQGFSTTGNIIIPFVGGVKPESVANGTVVSVSATGNVTLVNGTARGIIIVDTATNQTALCQFYVFRPFVAGLHTDSVVVAQPIKALVPNHTYEVVLTQSLQGSGGQVQPTSLIQLIKYTTPLVDANGKSRVSGVTDAQAAQLETLRLGYAGIWTRAENATGISRSNMVFAFQFGTQPLFLALPSMRARAVASGAALVNTTTVANGTANVTAFYNVSLHLPNSVAANISRVTFGQIQVPDLVGYTTGNATNGYFTGSGNQLVPPGHPLNPIASKGNLNVPALVLLPASVNPVPCVIFQHGVTRSKEDAFALASTLCSQGFGVIAVDLPLHGNLTLPGQTSGTGFINLASLRTGRDNLRQSSVDLFYVTQAITSGNTVINGTQAFATNPKPLFIGQSLGSIVGTAYAACDANNQVAILSVPGGRISTLLLNSPTFSPSILAGLAALGITPGTSTFTSFWLIAQTVIDDGDPMNYATVELSGALKGGTGSKILIQQAMNDTVITASATADLVNSMTGLTQVSATTVFPLLAQAAAPFVGSGIFQFPNAQHGFILDPTQGNTAGARFQALNYIGTFLATGNATIVTPVPFPREIDGGTTTPDTNDYSKAIYFGN